MDVNYTFAGLVVTNRDSAAGWYARLFGRQADMLPNDDEATWRMTDSSSFYLVADKARAGHGVFTFMVGDLDNDVAVIAGRGVETGPIQDVGGSGRRCLITDPDGNRVQVVQLSG